MKTNNYNIEKIIEFLTIKGNTNFINQQELLKIKSKLNKNTYKIYELYPDCNKVILYKKNIPTVKLLKICSGTGLRHQDILGAVFSLGLKDDMFGDILKYNGNYYIFTTKEKVIVLNKEFREVASEDKSQLAENKNDYQLIYKANKLMYEETILSKKAVTYKYYDSKTYKQLSKITLER